MSLIRVSRAELTAMGPCSLDARLAQFGRRKSMTAKQALDAGVSVENLLWVAGRLGLKRQCVQFALACAQRTAANNPDPHVQAAIDAAQAWVNDPSPAAWSAARSAESAARSAAWSAESAARSARSAAWSAARSAAESAAESAAWSAESAARSAAESAAWSAAWSAESAARSAAWSAARSAEQDAQKALFLEIFGGAS